MADPPFEAGFFFFGGWCRGLAPIKPCAQRIPRPRRAGTRPPPRAAPPLGGVFLFWGGGVPAPRKNGAARAAFPARGGGAPPPPRGGTRPSPQRPRFCCPFSFNLYIPFWT